MSEREGLKESRRWVIKIGSAVLTNHGRGLDGAALDGWVAAIAALRRSGHEVVVVSSGAVAEGMVRLGWKNRPETMYALQAAAAVGQMGLVRAYEARFERFDLRTAQILLTHEDLTNRARYLNARTTLRTLLELGVVPVVNENDTVATREMSVGDNDTLAALTANLLEANALVILTDQAGLFDANPREHPEAGLIEEARAGDKALESLAGEGGKLGRGGMQTKLTAASWAARSGAVTVIANGNEDNVIGRIAAGERLGTLLQPGPERVGARKRWIAGQLKVRGRLHLDAGAVRVLREDGKSLLPVGVRAVEGEFGRGDVVACIGPQGEEVARGLVGYTAEEARRIRGHSSRRIAETLGYVGDPELIHRDNMVLL